MLRLKAERRSPSTVSGATASESRITKTPDVVHSTRTTGDTSSVHARTYNAPLHTWTDVLAFFLFAALMVATAFIALYALLAVLFIFGQMVAS